MKIKYLQAAFAGLILSISGFTNAGLIVTQNNTASAGAYPYLGVGVFFQDKGNESATFCRGEKRIETT